jgi:arsenical resistance operon trans-acting repressor ArsD
VTIERFEPASDGNATAAWPAVQHLGATEGERSFPLVLVNNEIVAAGRYPSRTEWAHAIGAARVQARPARSSHLPPAVHSSSQFGECSSVKMEDRVTRLLVDRVQANGRQPAGHCDRVVRVALLDAANQHKVSKRLGPKTTDHGRPSPTMTDRVSEGFEGKIGRGERI